MPHLARIGTLASVTSATSQSATLTAGAAVGTTVVAALSIPTGTTQLTVSATDSKGNTWTAGTTSFRSSFGQVTLLYARITTALVSGDTVTFTASASASRWAADLHTFDDITNAPSIDKSATANNTTSTALDGGTTAATTSANELVFGAFCFGGVPAGAFTAASGFTSSGTVDAGASTTNRAVALEWMYVTATGTQDATGTLSAGSTYAGLTATMPVTVSADTTAPTVPSGVTATANSPTQVTVSWTASTDAVGVASYRVRQGGVDVTGATAVTGTSAVITGLTPSTAYSFTVSAVDAAGNRSAESTAATVTTPSTSTRSGKAKVWDGTAWVSHPVKVWDGTAWVVHPIKAWDGTSWVVGK